MIAHKRLETDLLEEILLKYRRQRYDIAYMTNNDGGFPNNVIQGPWGKKAKSLENGQDTLKSGSAPRGSTSQSNVMSDDFMDRELERAREFDNELHSTDDRKAQLRAAMKFMGESNDDFRGITPEFRQIYTSAQNSKPLESRIREELTNYTDWDTKQIKEFVSNPKNYPIFRQKPALVVALFRRLKQP